jgi:hypothetical protein
MQASESEPLLERSLMDNVEKIRTLNDAARTTFQGCRVMLTVGVQQLGGFAQVLDAVRGYSTFDESNDPHGEHDFGSFTFAGEQLFWKLDYYDLDLQMASPDPTDPTVTARVLTIMLADEY